MTNIDIIMVDSKIILDEKKIDSINYLKNISLDIKRDLLNKISEIVKEDSNKLCKKYLS